MKQIEKLTKKQESFIQPCVDEWVKKGLKTGETDWDTFNINIKLAYEEANIPFPNKIIRVNSPIVGALSATISDRIFNNLNIFKNTNNTVGEVVGNAVGNTVGNEVRNVVGDVVRDAVGGTVESAVRNVVEDAVRNTVRDAVGGTVESAVRNAVGIAVGDVVENAVRDAVGSAVENTVRDAVGNEVRNIVEDAVRDVVRNTVGVAVRNVVGNAVGGVVGGVVGNAVGDTVGGTVESAVEIIIKSKKLNWHNWLGGQFWVGGWYWSTAFSSFFIDYCKLKLSDNIIKRFNIYKKINESVNYIWCNKNFVIVCARPIMINLNNNNQLHSITQKSIEYPDGWGLYSFNGITIKEKLFNQLINKEYTFDNWTKEQNEEIKAVVLAFYEEKFGGEFVYRFLSTYLKEVDTYIDKKETKYLENTKGMNIGVYTLFKGNVNNINIAYVRCYCPSTDRMFFLGVHPDMNNAKDAIASLCQIPVKLQQHLISISRQGEIFSFNFNEIGTKMLKNQELTKEDYQNVVSLTGNEYFYKLNWEY